MEELLKALSEIASIAQNGISGSPRDDALTLARIRNIATAAQQSVHPTYGESAPLNPLFTLEVDSDLENVPTPTPRR